jgi:hypothetical protein
MNARRNTILRNLLAPGVMLAAASIAHAQQNSSINGTITDQAGAAIPKAHVILKEETTGFTKSADTNEVGAYTFAGLNIGTYDITVTMQGFETTVQKGVVLNISQDVHSDLSLTVGQTNETVTVTANALAIQTDSNVVSTLISGEEFTEIATENRNFAALVALGLGASSLLPDSNTPTSVGSSFAISFNGLRQSHNIWLIDGGEADDRGGAGGSSIQPSQDAIAQVETLSSNYPPDYGISSGATISMGLKSGGQKFHGELWEFNRNTDFNANTYFNKQSGSARAKLNYNIYGGNFSGPVEIPGLYNTHKDKTFFFWNEEWRRLIQGNNASSNNALNPADLPVAGKDLAYKAPAFAPGTNLLIPYVGDPAYNAKLTALGLKSCAPAAVGTPASTPSCYFPNNVVPNALFDANALAYLGTGVIPTANLANGQVISQASVPIDVRDDVVRIDHKLNDKWQILFHYLHDRVSQGSPSTMVGWAGATYSTVTSTFSNPSSSAALKVAGQIKPNLLLEASFNYDGNVIDIVNSSNGNRPSTFTSSKFFKNGSTSLPGLSLGAPYNTSEKFGSAPWHNAANDYEPKVDLSYTLGKHAMKFGASYNRYIKDQKLFLDAEGDYSISNPLTGDSAVDFILGLASSYSESQAAPIRNYVNETPSLYAYDTWQVTPRISLQLGFRYDGLPHAFERSNQVANFNPNNYLSSEAPSYLSVSGQLNPAGPGFGTVAGGTQAFYLNGITLAGVYGTPKGLVTNDWDTLQPRIGFSAKIFDEKTVLRGGFGTFYERLQGNDIYNSATNAPFANTPSASGVYVSNPSTSYQTGQTAATPIFAQGLTSLAPTYRAPAVAQYSLGIQRQMFPSVVGTFQYVGNMAWHQNIDRAINTYPLSTPLSIRQQAGSGGLANADFYRTYQGFSGITQQENTTNGGYNGLQIGIRAQNRYGLTGEVDYTYSHEIDISSYDLNGVSNPFNLKYDKASGAFDRRHILSSNYVYKLPIFNHSQGLEHSLLGGWEVAGTIIAQTGTIIGNNGPTLNGNDIIGLGGGYTNRPNLVGKVQYTKVHGGAWINPSNFSQPLAAWQGSLTQGFGNAGRDSVIGPGRLNFTTSLYKGFALTERVNFEFRAESYNTFNHTEFSSLNNGFGGNSGFGHVNGTYDPRNLEFGAKLKF